MKSASPNKMGDLSDRYYAARNQISIKASDHKLAVRPSEIEPKLPRTAPFLEKN